MTRAPLPADEAGRLTVLRGYDVLDTPAEEVFDRIVRLAAVLAGTPIAVLSLVDLQRCWFKAAVGLPIRQTPRDHSFCGHVLPGDAVLVVEDALDAPRFSRNPLVTGPPRLRFLAGAPLRCRSGHRLGALWVADHQPRDLTPRARAGLAELAAAAIDILELRLTLRLAGAENDRLRANQEAPPRTDPGVASALMRVVVENSEDPIFVKNLDGQYLLLNRACARAMGHAVQDILGRTDHDVLPAEVVPALRAIDTEVAQTGKTIVAEELLPSPLGPRTYLTTKSPLIGADGAVTGVVGIARDITARKLAEEQLVTAKEEADQANRAKSEFLSAMSHELRTPLNAVLGFSEMLELNTQTPLMPTQRKCVSHIRRAGQHLLDLINEILDLARIESGRANLALEAVDVRLAVQESLSLVQSMAEPRGILVLAEERPLSPPVRADGVRLIQVLVNLLSNAIKYNKIGGRVTLCESLTAGRRLRLTVTDSGPGLTPERLEQLFQPFNRLGAEGSGVEGTGIGLTITRRLVEMMGGEMGVSSQVGKGSAFWVELPLAEAEPGTGSPASPASNEDDPAAAIGPARFPAALSRFAGGRP